jgi:beta-lactamase superfamily II metal-dependent hydrolase
MTCEFAFLAIGNADSIVISPENDDPSIVIDIPKPRAVTNWLRNRNKLDIAWIYITHAHRDHFAPLVRFTAFLEQWLGVGGTVSNVFVADDTLRSAWDDLAALKNSNEKRFNELHRALERLLSWREKAIHFDFHFRRPTPSYSEGDLSVRVLHPELLFSAKHTSRAKTRLNERSLLLRVSYGKFVAILLADLEGEGLADCLTICSEEELRANLVKIPHHGAWPKNGSDLNALLRTIDAEIAVLSVGSKNTYGHVAPELFSLLLALKADRSMRLDQFLCTEVTRTCKFSSLERKAMGRAGLPAPLPCAGDISILADTSGKWELKTETNHAVVISGVPYAACENRAELSVGLSEAEVR